MEGVWNWDGRLLLFESRALGYKVLGLDASSWGPVAFFGMYTQISRKEPRILMASTWRWTVCTEEEEKGEEDDKITALGMLFYAGQLLGKGKDIRKNGLILSLSRALLLCVYVRVRVFSPSLLKTKRMFTLTQA